MSKNEPMPIASGVFAPGDGGGRRDRTDDLLLAKQALSQLSYSPILPFSIADIYDQSGGPG